MDVPGQDTTADQLKAIHDPAVDLGTLPEFVFQTFPFEMTASLLNPFGGDLIDTAQLRLTLHGTTAFAAGDVTAVSKADGQPVAFTVDANGDLVGKWGADSGFPVAPGYNVSTTFTVTVAAGAPTGAYTVTLDLVDVDDPATVLAHETGTITVNENATTVLWGDTLPKFVTQGVAMTVPLSVYSPADGTAELTLSVTGPAEDPATPDSEALAAGDLKVYGSIGTDMVAMPLTLNAGGQLVGTWNAVLLAGYNPVTWYATVAEGAPVGSYALGVGLTGGNTLAPFSVVVFAPEAHGEQPPDAGDDTTAPVLTVTPVGDLTSTASFTLTANEDTAVFECMLTTNGTAGTWEACTSPKTYSDLPPASYAFSARATDEALNVSAVFTTPTWTVDPPAAKDTDFTGDGNADVVARDTAGKLWVYPGNGTGGWLARRLVGSGWNTFTGLVVPGDFSGDGNPDVLARDAAGELWMYQGNGTGGWLPRVKIGTGWNSMTALVPGDFSGDGNPDVLARDAVGVLWMYRGNGTGGWLLNRVKIGTGWNSMTARGPGDFTGDGKADVLARDAAGELYLYRGNGTGGWRLPGEDRHRLERHDRPSAPATSPATARPTCWPATPQASSACTGATAPAAGSRRVTIGTGWNSMTAILS